MTTKKSVNMTESERVLALYAILMFDSHPLTTIDLSERLGCSTQAVSRALARVTESGFGTLVKGKIGHFTSYRLEFHDDMPRLVSGSDNLVKLELCHAFLMHLLPEQVRTSLAAALPSTYSVREIIDYQPFLSTIETMLTAIRLHRVCDVHYLASQDGEEKTCFFAPQKLITRNNAIHARGWMVTSSGMASAVSNHPDELPVHLITQIFPTHRGADHLSIVDETREDACCMEE